MKTYVGIAWPWDPVSGAPRSASLPQETPRTFQQSMPAHAANADSDLGLGQVGPMLVRSP